MDIYLVLSSIISSTLAGMGVGGGAIFVFLITNLCNIQQKEAQFLNLILFISVSISVILLNLKNKKIKFNLIKKIIFPLSLGVLIGTNFVRYVNEIKLKKYFSVFLLILGLYEIFSSLISIRRTKNNSKQ